MEPFTVTPEQELWQAAGRGFEALFRAAPARDVVRASAGMLAVGGVPIPDLNCGVVWAADGAASAIRELAGELVRRRLPGILLVADSAGPEARAAAAEARLLAAARMPLMTRVPGTLDGGSRYTTRRARSTADLRAANRSIAAAFEIPVEPVDTVFGPGLLDSSDVAVELVLEGDDPVGSLQTTSCESLVGVWSMATPPASRRRGIARSGLSQVLERRFSSGAALAFLVATEAGRPLYDAVGFRTVAWCTAWVCSPGADGR